MFGLDDIASIAGIGGSILGGLGKGKGTGPTSLSGFASEPQPVQDLMNGPIFDKIKEILNTGYKGIPLRRINSSDLDPVFGSPARQDLQAYKDYQAKNAPTTSTPSAGDASGVGLAAIGRLAAQNGSNWTGGGDPKLQALVTAAQRAPGNNDSIYKAIGEYLSSGAADDYSSAVSTINKFRSGM